MTGTQGTFHFAASALTGLETVERLKPAGAKDFPESVLEADRKIGLVLERMRTGTSSSTPKHTETVIKEDGSASTYSNLEETTKVLTYYMTRQARNMSRASKPRGGTKVGGRSAKKPYGI